MVFSFVFWKNWRHQKVPFEINWPVGTYFHKDPFQNLWKKNFLKRIFEMLVLNDWHVDKNVNVSKELENVKEHKICYYIFNFFISFNYLINLKHYLETLFWNNIWLNWIYRCFVMLAESSLRTWASERIYQFLIYIHVCIFHFFFHFFIISKKN